MLRISLTRVVMQHTHALALAGRRILSRPGKTGKSVRANLSGLDSDAGSAPRPQTDPATQGASPVYAVAVKARKVRARFPSGPAPPISRHKGEQRSRLQTRNPEPQPPNPKPQTPNPKP